MFNHAEYDLFFEYAELALQWNATFVQKVDEIKVSHLLLFITGMMMVHYFVLPSVMLIWRSLMVAVKCVCYYLIVVPTRFVVGRVMVWYYVRDSPLDLPSMDSSIIASSFGFDASGPHVIAIVDGVKRRISIEPFLALNMKVSVGKEASIPGSVMTPFDGLPKGTFTFFVDGQFVGCGFRLAIHGHYYLVTAKHVYEKFTDQVVIRIGTRSMRYTPVLVGSGENSDFVLLRDDFIVGQFIKTLTGALYQRNSFATIVGTANGGVWYRTQGMTVPCKGRAFGFVHQATTHPGWSGCPIFDKNGKVIGVHTGSKTENDQIVNEATAIYDVVSALLSATKSSVVTKESFEEYDSNVWKTSQIGGSVNRADKLTFGDSVLKLNSYEWNFSLDDWEDTDEMDFTVDPDFVDETKESADFQSGLGKDDLRQQKNCTSSETMSETKLRLMKSKLRRMESSTTVGKETERSPFVNPDQSTRFTSTSRKQKGSTGHNGQEQDLSSRWATMVASIDLKDTTLVLKWLTEPSIKLSKNSSRVLRAFLSKELNLPIELVSLVSLDVLRVQVVRWMSKSSME